MVAPQLRAVALTSALIAVVLPASATACSYLCRAGAAPSDGGTIPSNAPAVVLQAFGVSPTPAGQDGGTLLLDASGAPVAHSVEIAGTTAFLRATFEPDQVYRLRYANVCADGQTADAGWSEASFSTASPVAYPDASASLDLTDQGVGAFDVLTSCGSCFVSRTAAFARFGLAFPPEWGPFLPITRVRLEVDGTRWAESEFGAPAGAASLPGGPIQGAKTVGAVYSVCTRGTESVFDDGLTEGTHELRWFAEIAGRAPVEIARARVTLSCEGASADGVDCRGRPQAGDAGASPDGVGQPGDAARPGGCWGGGAAVAVLGLVVPALRRRRR